MTNYAVVVAGGSGSRMQSAIPKQFLLLAGEPVLMHTIRAFHLSEARPHIIVVLHPDFQQQWQILCGEHNFTLPHQVVNGGETRFHSVKNGLAYIHNDNAIVAIHDAVRPLTDISIIDHSFNYAAEYGNAITVVKSRDSVRQLKGKHSVSLLRDEIYLV